MALRSCSNIIPSSQIKKLGHMGSGLLGQGPTACMVALSLHLHSCTLKGLSSVFPVCPMLCCVLGVQRWPLSGAVENSVCFLHPLYSRQHCLSGSTGGERVGSCVCGNWSPQQPRVQAVGSAGSERTHFCLCGADTEQRRHTPHR